jgi:hypothetical protein
LLEDLLEPPRSDDVGSQSLRSPPQLAIRGDERHRSIRSTRDDFKEHVIAAAGGVEDRDTVVRTSLCASASLAFQHDDHGLSDPSRVNGRSQLV